MQHEKQLKLNKSILDELVLGKKIELSFIFLKMVRSFSKKILPYLVIKPLKKSLNLLKFEPETNFKLLSNIFIHFANYYGNIKISIIQIIRPAENDFFICDFVKK